MPTLFLQPGCEAESRCGIVALVKDVSILVPWTLDEVATARCLVRIIIFQFRNRKRELIERLIFNGELKQIIAWSKRLD